VVSNLSNLVRGLFTDYVIAPVGGMTGSAPASSGASTALSASRTSGTGTARTSSGGSLTQSASTAAQSSGVANAAVVQPLAGVIGLGAMMFGLF
jgi:hypothetical protein